MKCRFDGLELEEVFIDLGYSPVSNDYLSKEDLTKPEVTYPLKVFVSERTFLVQIEEFKRAEDIFSKDYAYFSSYSKSWLAHCEKYSSDIIERLDLTKDSLAVEIASNDGYLLKNFRTAGIPCLGIEPSLSVAQVAINQGIPTEVSYFNVDLATNIIPKYSKADLVICNNVLAHVPDLVDFVEALKLVLKTTGTITIEVPHLVKLIQQNQFDTIYHEHFWYFSLYSLNIVFQSKGLKIYDVEELSTHGGSLRLFITHSENDASPVLNTVGDLLNQELLLGVNTLDFYKGFSRRAYDLKMQFWEFIVKAKKNNKTIAGYGAAAKGNTLLNFYGVGKDEIQFIIDASPYKQNRFTPGSHIPIVDISKLEETKPDFIIIFPWNIKKEIFETLDFTRKWGTKLVTPIPKLEII
ncbi:MAG: methyltransferase domain-containing protein [Bacteroidota bacterium]